MIPFIELISTVGRNRQVLLMSLNAPSYNTEML